MKNIIFSAALAAATTATADTHSNLQVVVDAAREMEWVQDGNRAFLLIKTVTVRAEVGLIFGYVDNRRACKELATALSENLTVGAFECAAVY